MCLCAHACFLPTLPRHTKEEKTSSSVEKADYTGRFVKAGLRNYYVTEALIDKQGEKLKLS
ncbi:hypothetical protein TDB9533_00018 [Thalassocella blandensis]|nr:hypothetical protein TDB9533_00018 [Thalassocella blandensis]